MGGAATELQRETEIGCVRYSPADLLDALTPSVLARVPAACLGHRMTLDLLPDGGILIHVIEVRS